MTIGRDLIVQAFPGQPRMQAGIEALIADTEDTLARLKGALAAIDGLSGDAAATADLLAAKQPRNDTLTAISLLLPDPGVIEQLQAGQLAIRPIDTVDTHSLLTRNVADTRYLGGAHGAVSAAKLTTARTITASGDAAWTVTFDGSANVTAALTLATVNANTGTFGGATTSAQISVNGKGLITGVSAITITPAWTSITGTPTTLAGYGITNGQTLNANLTAISGLTTAADKMIYWTGAGAAALLTVTSANRTALSALSGTNTGDQTITLTGDATGSGTGSFAVTVGKINGVALSGLATGILKNTTTTGAPSIAVAADFPTLNQNTTGSASTLTTGRTIAITGDLAYTSAAFDGSGNVTGAGTLATVNGNVGSFGSATQVATFTVNAKGLTTAAANVTVTPAVGSITGLGTGVATALAVNVGAAGAFITFNGALGTPSSGTLTNATGLPISTGVSGLGTGIATFLATPSSANLASAITDETGSGALVFAASPAFTGTLTAAAGTLSGHLRSGGASVSGQTSFGSGKGLEHGYVNTSFGGFIQTYDRDTSAYLPTHIDGLSVAIDHQGVNKILTTSAGITITGAATTTGDQVISGTGKTGYTTGSGGTVTQITSKATGVTLSKTNGQIVTHNAALAAAAVVSFTVTNTTVAATDTINLNLATGNATAGTYRYWIDKVSAGSFVIAIENRSAGSLSEALTFNYSLVKAVTS